MINRNQRVRNLSVIKKTFLPAGKNVPIINIRTRNINEKKRRNERRRKGKRRILPQKVNKMSHFCSINIIYY